MEDIRKRLEFKNPSIQIQAVWKLYSELLKKKPSKDAINSSTPEILELKVLWESCCSGDHVVVEASCQAVFKLVFLKHADFTFILNTFLNLLPSARNLRGIVWLLGELLTLQGLVVTETGQKYHCPYSVRNPPHPLITVLTNRPESWPLLQQLVYRICCHDNKRVQQVSTEILLPFIKFVLLEPQQTPQYQRMKYGLQRALLDICLESSDEESFGIVKCLVSILPAFQIQNMDDHGNLMQFLMEILKVSSRLPSEEDSSTLFKLSFFAISLIKPCNEISLDTSFLEQTVVKVGKKFPKSVSQEVNIAVLADLIMSTNSENCHCLLQLAKIILENLDTCCSVVAAMLVLPVLQTLSAPALAVSSNKQKRLGGLASDILTMIERWIKLACDRKTKHEPDHIPSLTVDGHSNQCYISLAHTLTSKSGVWLQHLKESIKNMKSIPLNLTNIVSALLVTSTSRELTSITIEVLVEIAKQDHSQAPNFLPLLLYQVGRVVDPETKLVILEAIPAMATHKVCISPILRILQLLGNTAKLKGLSIRLMTSLWKLQNRVFPQLLKVLTEEDDGKVVSECGVDEIVLAKAAAIRDICQLRPEQHGADLLSPLSDILNKYSNEQGAAASALALEGLVYVCEAEVIDIKSAWSVLAAKLTQDDRPVVVEKICDLFALVPSLAVNTPEFDAFMAEVVHNLWLYCHSNNDIIQGAAYEALSNFTVDHFRVSYLPLQVTEDFCRQAKIVAEQQDDPGLTVDSILTFVPGICFTRLLTTVRLEVLGEFESFLSSLVAKEVENLPRGIYYSSLRRQGAAANQGKAIGAIPAFILSQYEKTNQPGLRPSLAAGLLFCYDPPVVVGRDGRPRRHYIVTHGKNYQQMFSTLLNEVPVQPSEWHRSMLIPQAWTSFMDRFFTAMLEGKKAELGFLSREGGVERDEAKLKQDLAWLWVRDAITDLIKEASRGNPTMQANSILALAGLAVSVSRYATGLDKESLQAAENITEHLSHSHWLMITIDTIMSILDVTYKPKGKIHGLCQQQTVGKRVPASLLARASACVALPQLVPIFITTDCDKISQIITIATAKLPGRPKAEESPVLQFHYGLGLGMFLGRLFEEHFSDIGGTKGMLEVWKSLDVLEECCLSTDIENRSGALLGLGLAISGLCEEGKTDSRVHVSAIQEKLMLLCEKTEVNHDSYQTLSVCMSCIAGRAFAVNILPMERVNAVVDRLQRVHQSNPEVTGVCLALGMVCYSLSKIGHPAISQLRHQLVNTWTQRLVSEDTPPLEKVSVLNGLMALIGSERTLITVQSIGTSLMGSDVSVNDIIKMASYIVSSHSDLGIQSNSAWMLGHLYLSACAVTETRASVPPSYSYLSESSVLRPVVDLLVEAGKRGPEFVAKDHVKVALVVLQEEVTKALPPVNWAGILSPLMRIDFGSEVKCLCLKLAIIQSLSAPTAAMFLSSWVTPPLYNSLNADCKEILYRSLPYLIRVVAPSVLTTFLERGCFEPFVGIPNMSHCIVVLHGLNKALLVGDPPDAVTAVLYKATEKFYKDIPPQINVRLYCLLSDCLCNLPDELLDKITLDDFDAPATHLKGAFVRCYAVANGYQPMALLNSCIDATMNSTGCNKAVVMYLLAQCFHQSASCKSDYTGVVSRLQWLLELMGHLKNTATGAVTLAEQAPPLVEVMKFAIDVVALAATLWTSPAVAAVVGLHSELLTIQADDDPETLGDNDLEKLAENMIDILEMLPSCVGKLEREPWDQMLSKMIDWVTVMTQLTDAAILQGARKKLGASLLMLRHCKDFRKAAVWTRVFSMMDNI